MSSIATRNKLPFLKFLLQTNTINYAQAQGIDFSISDDLDEVIKFILTKNILSEQQLSAAKKQYLNMKQVDLLQYEPLAFENKLPENFAREYSCCVIAVDQSGYIVAMSNPSAVDVCEQISEILNGYFTPVLADLYQLERHINLLYKRQTTTPSVLSNHADGKFLRKNTVTTDNINSKEDSNAAIKFLEDIISEAYYLKASDIHIEYTQDKLRIRYRIDGILQTKITGNADIAKTLVRRLQVLASIDISHHLRGEDGKLNMHIDGEKVSMRISIMPIEDGQSVVVRFLGSIKTYENIAAVVGDGFVTKLMLDYLQKSYGMLLIAGPTGSGKTTTQYSALMSLDRDKKKVISIEDPVEAYLPGVNQIPVNPERQMDFADILRFTLRQDPDVIMLGEIRDESTANMSMRAAITGHMVLATIHTYNVTSAITRLLNLGVDYNLLAAALRLLVSQRLLRKLCPYCKTEHILSLSDLPSFDKQHLDDLVGKQVYKSVGCEKCSMTGYIGRIGVFEIVKIDKELAAFLDSKDLAAFNTAMQERLTNSDLLSQALKKVYLGETSISEAISVLHD